MRHERPAYRGGAVVDGTGTAARRLDVRVRKGFIVEMSSRLTAKSEPVIDAGGAIVAPDFIDSHTHYDATIYWDPLATRCRNMA